MLYHFHPKLEHRLKSPSFSVVIQRVSLDEPASSAADRSQTFISLHREDGTAPTEDMSDKWYMHCCHSLVSASTQYSLVVHSNTAMGWNGA